MGDAPAGASPHLGDEFNFDVFVIPGTKLASGETTVDFVLGGSPIGSSYDAFDQIGELDGYGTQTAMSDTIYDRRKGAATGTAIAIGNEVGIKIAASVDDFNTIVSSGAITIDKQGANNHYVWHRCAIGAIQESGKA